MDDNLTLEDQPRRRWRFLPSFSAGGKRRRIALWVLAPSSCCSSCSTTRSARSSSTTSTTIPTSRRRRSSPMPAARSPWPPPSSTARCASIPGRPTIPGSCPGAVLDNMPNYQQGIIQALRRFTLEMTDQIGRARGSSQADPDLERARSSLNYATTSGSGTSASPCFPTATSPQQYKAAEEALLSYNKRLAAGTAVFDRRADNLLATLDRIAKDLGSSSAALEQQIEQHSGDWFDFQADDRFYRTKGELYAYALLLRDLGNDFEPVIKERGLQTVWANMIENPVPGGRAAALGRHQRRARQPGHAEPPGGAGLLPAARARPDVRDHGHPHEIGAWELSSCEFRLCKLAAGTPPRRGGPDPTRSAREPPDEPARLRSRPCRSTCRSPRSP